MKKMAFLVSGDASTPRHFVRNGLTPAVAIAYEACSAYTFARSEHLYTHFIERKDEVSHTREVLRVLLEYEIELALMMGWEASLDEEIFREYKGEMLCSSLSPSLDRFDKRTAQEIICTIRFGPAGPKMGQVAVRIGRGEDIESFKDRVEEEQSELYFGIVRTLGGV